MAGIRGRLNKALNFNHALRRSAVAVCLVMMMLSGRADAAWLDAMRVDGPGNIDGELPEYYNNVMAVDHQGILHVVYYQTNGPILVHKTWDGAAWSEPDYIPQSAYADNWSLLIDSQDRLIVMWRWNFSVVKVAIKDVEDWHQTIELAHDIYRASAYLDSRDRLFIAAVVRDQPYSQMTAVFIVEGEAVRELPRLPGALDHYRQLSVVEDPGGQIWLIYGGTGIYPLLEESWSWGDLVALPVGYSWDVNGKFDTTGILHVAGSLAYLPDIPNPPFYVTFDGRAWSDFDYLDRHSYYQPHPSLDLNAGGEPRVVFCGNDGRIR